MPRTQILSSDAPAPSGGYSQAIRASDFLYLAGQGPSARTTIQSDLIGFDVDADAVVWLGD